MFEARLTQGALLKKVVDAVKDLVGEANLDVNSTGLSLQAMDSSHVSLTAMSLRADGFEHYRCDRPISMGESCTHKGRSSSPTGFTNVAFEAIPVVSGGDRKGGRTARACLLRA